MPLSIDTSDVPPDLKSSHVPVYWRPFDCDFRANIQSGQWEVDDINYVRDLCSNAVSLKKEHSKLKQRSIIQLLKCASSHNVSISCVTLDQSLDKIDKDEMILTSGITLPKLLTLEKTHIETKGGRELTEDDVINISTYALQSKRLKELSFGKCLLPLSFSSRSISNEIINRNVQVTCCRYGYRFDFQSGLWEVDDVDTVRRLCSSPVYIERTDSKLLQKWTIKLLKNASDNGIPITNLWLYECSPIVSKSDLTIRLDSGLSLPVLNSLHVLSIHDVGRTLTNEEFVAFLRYSSECTSLIELWFWSGYTLPETVPQRLIPFQLIHRDFIVQWNYGEHRKSLYFRTGIWNTLLDSNDQQQPFCKKQKKKETADKIPELTGDSFSNLRVRHIVDSEGKVLTIPNTNVSLNIPKGALEKEYLVDVRIIQANIQDSQFQSFTANSCVTVELLPNCLTLSVPAKLTLPHCLLLKEGVKTTAKVFESHHKEGERPHWKENHSVQYEIRESGCNLWITQFCLVYVEIGSEAVEAKRLTIFVAKNSASMKKIMHMEVGYYPELPGKGKIITDNKLEVLQRKPLFFQMEGEMPLEVSLQEIIPPTYWGCTTPTETCKQIAYNSIAISEETSCKFVLKAMKRKWQESVCVFKAAQGDNEKELACILQYCFSDNYCSNLSVRGKITTKGGSLSIPNTVVDIGIPPGALEEDCDVEIRIIPDVSQDKQFQSFTTNSCVTIELLPRNLTLKEPAKLTVPHCLQLKDESCRTAKIFESHHEEGETPLWTANDGVQCEIRDDRCKVWVTQFCWIYVDIGKEAVIAKELVAFVAKLPTSSTENVHLEVGYCLDLPARKIITDNNLQILQRKPLFFKMKENKPLKVHFQDIPPKYWSCGTNVKSKEISHGRISMSEETSFSYVLTSKKKGWRKKWRDFACSFTVAQGRNAKELTCILKSPSSSNVAEPSQEEGHTTYPQSSRYKSPPMGEMVPVEDMQSSRYKSPPMGEMVPVEDMQYPQSSRYKSHPMGKMVSVEDLQSLSKKIGDYCKQVARALELITEADIENIRRDFPRQEEVSYQILLRWQRRNGHSATNSALVTALKKAERKDLADDFEEEVKNRE